MYVLSLYDIYTVQYIMIHDRIGGEQRQKIKVVRCFRRMVKDNHKQAMEIKFFIIIWCAKNGIALKH